MAGTTRVHWTEQEWDDVILDLHKHHPIAMTSSTLMGIKSEDVFASMRRVLPEDRHRASMNMTQVRPKLLERVAALRKEIARVEQERQREEQRQEALRQEEARLKTQSDIFNPVLEALANKLFQHLRPMLEEYIVARIGGSSPAQAEAVMSHHREKKVKPKVGVIGLLPIQANDMEREFPNLDFTFVEGGANSRDVKAKLANVDVIFGLTAKMGHNAEYVLRNMPVWNNYKRVDGKGPSSMKRSIQIWLDEQR